MKKKAVPTGDVIIDPEIRRKARRMIEKPAPPSKCVICGSPCAPTSTEGLCWVCRRLKISAWRDSDTQAASQE
jgi:hypothetical protein